MYPLTHIFLAHRQPIGTSKFSSTSFLTHGSPLQNNNVFLACIIIEILLSGISQIPFASWMVLLNKVKEIDG